MFRTVAAHSDNVRPLQDQRVDLPLVESELLRKRRSFLEFSLCSSRACVGKMMHFIYKWRQKWSVSLPNPPAEKNTAVSSFPSLCPEPVMANIRLSAQNGSKNAGVFRTSSLPNTEQAIWVAKVEPEYPEKHILFLSAFPMFVPSLSWQNNAF